MTKELWQRSTGINPNRDTPQREWYRTAILEGVPEIVRKSMSDNPDLPGADSSVWERHLVHHLTRAREEQQKEDTQLHLISFSFIDSFQTCQNNCLKHDSNKHESECI